MAYTLKGKLAALEAKVAGLPTDPADASDVAGLIAALDTLIDGAIAKIDAGFALTGDAVVANVLDGKFFYKDNYQTKLEGTMPNNAGDVASVSAHMGAGTTLHVVPAEGYTDGVDDASTVDLAAVDTDLAAANVKTGVAILGVTGTYDTEAGNPIEAATVLTGKIGFVNGSKITGTMANNEGAVACVSASITAGTTLSVVPATGYTDGVDDTSTIDLTTVDADLVTDNIKAGVTILGVEGKTEVVDTTEAVNAATAADIALGKVAFVNGVKITGTHE